MEERNLVKDHPTLNFLYLIISRYIIMLLMDNEKKTELTKFYFISPCSIIKYFKNI